MHIPYTPSSHKLITKADKKLNCKTSPSIIRHSLPLSRVITSSTKAGWRISVFWVTGLKILGRVPQAHIIFLIFYLLNRNAFQNA